MPTTFSNKASATDYVDAYNLYDNGTSTGAQVSIFIGSIWVDEVVSLFLKTGADKQPVYPYSSPFYDRAMTGHYVVTGTIGLLSTESDKLAKIMQLVKSGQMSDSDLSALVTGQTTKFAQTLAYRYSGSVVAEKEKEIEDLRAVLKNAVAELYARTNVKVKADTTYADAEGEIRPSNTRSSGGKSYLAKGKYSDPVVGTDDGTAEYMDKLVREFHSRIKIAEDAIKNVPAYREINDYIERITREVELINSGSSIAGKGIKPFQFKLTIVKGDLTDPNAAITIYEDAEISGTGESKVNDDQVNVLMYDIIARKKPDMVRQREEEVPVYGLSKKNLLNMMYEVANGLVDDIMNSSSIQISETMTRTSLLSQTNRFGFTGYIVPGLRSYGAPGSFSEVVYSYRLKKTYVPAKGTIPLEVTKNGKVEKTPVRFGQGKISNTFGQVCYPHPEYNSNDICAVAPVVIEKTNEPTGVSLVLAQHNVRSTGQGESMPPYIISPDDFTSYRDNDVPELTKKTLWLCPIGVRSTPSVNHPLAYKANITEASNKEELSDIEKAADYMCELSHPVNSLAYVESITGVAENGKYSLVLAHPAYVDFIDIDKTKRTMDDTRTGYSLLNAKSASVDPKLVPSLKLKFTWNNGTATCIQLNKDDKILGSVSGCTVGIYRQSIVVRQEEEDEDLIPLFFNVTVTPGESPSAVLYQTLYVAPIVVRKDDNLSETGTGDGMNANWRASVEYNPTTGEATAHNVVDLTTYNESTGRMDDSGSMEEVLARILCNRKGKDDTCYVDLTYDWVASEVEGMTTARSPVTVSGVSFVKITDTTLLNSTVMASVAGSAEKQKVTIDRFRTRDADSGEIVGVPIDIYWVVGVLPVYSPVAYEAGTEDIRLITNKAEPAGYAVDLYAFTRCDVPIYNESVLVNYVGDGSLGDRFKAYIKRAYEIITTGRTTTEYIYPMKARLEHYAAFCQGFTMTVNKRELARSILLLEFTGEGIPQAVVEEVVKRKKARFLDTVLPDGTIIMKGSAKTRAGVTMDDLLYFVTGDETQMTTIYSTLATYIGERLKTLWTHTKDETSDVITVRKEIVAPPAKTVIYGFTSEGYKELTQAKRLPLVGLANNDEKMELEPYGV